MGVARRVGVQRGHRAVVAGVHGLQHVERFGAAALADDDPVGPHTQGVRTRSRGRDRALAFDVRRPRFQPHDVVLLQLQFGRVLDRDDAVVVRDEARQRVEQRRLAASRCRREMMMFSRALMRAFQQHRHLGRERLVVEQVFQLQRVGAEAANATPTAPSRASGGMMALTRRAVGQAGVDHRATFVDAPADLRHDAVDDLQQVVVVAELDVGLLHLAAAFDVDLVRPVDQDIADRRVLEQQLQRAEAERLVEHLVDEALALDAVEQRVFGVAQVLDDQADLAAQRVAFQVADARQVELVDQLAVDEALQLLEALGALAIAAGRRSSRPGG